MSLSTALKGTYNGIGSMAEADADEAPAAAIIAEVDAFML